MKNTAFLFITLVVGSLASPTIPAVFGKVTVQDVSRNERIVTGQIIQAINDLSQQIRDAGLDPMERSLEVGYELPVPVILSANAIVDNFLFTGLSNIVVETMNFSLLRSTLNFNIVLPGIAVSVDKTEAKAIVFGNEYSGAISGSININTIRLIGEVRVNIGITGISVRSLTLQFTLGGIESNVDLNLFGKDLSSRVNTLLGTTIPATLTKFSSEINELLEIVALSVINDALGNSFF